MRPQAFQYGQLRDENDNIIRDGAYGKDTPIVNARNEGVLDYVMNNFDVVWAAIQAIEAASDTDFSDFYTKEQVDALIPTRVGSLTNDAGYITATATVNGATHDGAGNDITATYAPINSPILTGEPKAPTQDVTDNSTKIATTAYVRTLFGTITNGYDGGYYIPQVDSNNNLTWVASKNTMPEITDSVNVKGDVGATGATGAAGGYYIPSVDSDGVLSWTPTEQSMPTVEDSYIRGATGATGATGAAGTNGEDGGYYVPAITDNVMTFTKSKNSMPDLSLSVNVKGDTGATGNGIDDITMNADYTLTITYTDGTSYTTTSIRGEKGEQGEVGTIETLTTAEVDAIWDNI